MQRLEIIGNLGTDATIREGNGKKFLSFSVGVDSSYKNSDGQKVKRTTWYDCTYHKGESKIVEYLTKGTLIFAEGEPAARGYEKDGEIRAALNLRVRNIELLNVKKD